MKKKIESIIKQAQKLKIREMEVEPWRSSVRLYGRARHWDDKIKAGYYAAKKGFKAVINDIEVDGISPDRMSLPSLKDNLLQGRRFDVVVIGGGVIGCAILRELSRYHLSLALLEKEEDIARHASSRNDGMVHPGFAAKLGTLKAGYNIRGNAAYTQVSRELGFHLERVGTIILYKNSWAKIVTPILIDRARQHGLKGYRYLSRDEVFKMEPHITSHQHGGFYLPTTGVISPYQATVAYAENAVQNGAELFLNTVVLGMERKDGVITEIRTNRGTLFPGLVVNAAGVWADVVADMADDRFFSLHGRKGADCVLDIKTGRWQKSVLAMPDLMQMKSKTKGGGLVPTVEGNLIAGPTAVEVPYREDYATGPQDLDPLLKHLHLNTKIGVGDVINYFAGVRACTYEEDFIIEASENVGNLVHAAGIQSPGLASAPAIAEDVAKICVGVLKRQREVLPNPRFDPVRPPRPELKSLPFEERARLIRKNPSYGRIVCRCEEISEGEIRDCLASPIPVNTLDGVKRRTRAGAGRCHGGFCTPRVLEIMSGDLQQPITSIRKKGEGSEILLAETKDKVNYFGFKTRADKGKKP